MHLLIQMRPEQFNFYHFGALITFISFIGYGCEVILDHLSWFELLGGFHVPINCLKAKLFVLLVCWE